MIKTTHAGALSPLGSEYNDFLFAPIGEDTSGMLLSVLSALARLDIDPWEEAARLARLSVESATQKLASLITALPEGAVARPDARATALRLIALLPRTSTGAPSPRAPRASAGAIRSPAVISIIVCMIFMVFVLVGQWLVARLHQPPAAVAAPTASGAPSPKMPYPPTSDRR